VRFDNDGGFPIHPVTHPTMRRNYIEKKGR
jgi:hypothetical protein